MLALLRRLTHLGLLRLLQLLAQLQWSLLVLGGRAQRELQRELAG